MPTGLVTPVRRSLLLPGLQGYRAAVLADKPLTYWRLGETSGTNAVDERGNFAGTYAGTPSLGVPGALPADPNKALQCDGIDDVVSSASPVLTSGTDYAIECWAKTSSLTQSGMLVFNGHTGLGAGFSQGFTGTANAGLYYYENGIRTTVGWSFVDTTSWHHIVLAQDNVVDQKKRFYVDGVLITNPFGGGNPNFTVGFSTVGAQENSTDTGIILPWVGFIDEVAFYNHGLAQASVWRHYAAGVGLMGQN